MREQIEPEGFFDDPQDETRPALGDEAKQALDLANQRRNNLQPILDKDAETAAMVPNDYQAAFERLKAQRASVPPMVPATTRDKPRDDRSDPSSALAQLQAQRAASASVTPPPPSALSRPPMSSSANGTGPNRPLSMDLSNDIPSARDLAANVGRRSLVDAKPSSTPSVPPPLPPQADDPDVIKSLLGGAVPAPPRHHDSLAMTGGTAPMKLAELGLKPPTGAMPAAPQRAPAPIAVGGKTGGLMIQTDRPGSMPPAGFGTKTPPGMPAVGRPSMPSRPPGAFGPAPGFGPTPSTAPKQYDFKRWSSPDISEMPNDGSPVTFQVYTAQDVAQGRGPMRSLPVIDQQPKSSGSIAMKVGLAVLGGVIVLITAAAVIMVSTDDPKKPDGPAPEPPPSISAAVEPPPQPPFIVIPGDPVAPPATSAVAPVPAPAPAPPPAPIEEPSVLPTPKKPRPAPAPAGNAPKPPAPVTPPPNPYGKP